MFSNKKENQIWEKDGILKRYRYNPILRPVKKHSWESKMVYNCAAFRADNNIYLIYRAFGDDHLSRLGLACSKNGKNIINRLKFPIFEPKEKFEIPSYANYIKRKRERGGCEDPRVTVINNKIYTVYTAYSQLCQIALASMDLTIFFKLINKALEVKGNANNFNDIKGKWNNSWCRYGKIFPEFSKKNIFSRNACIFPIEIDGKLQKYALIYRKEKGPIMITYSQNPIGPWGNRYKLLSPIQPWEKDRIGICTPPIKTNHGLFFIYHGVEPVKKENIKKIYHLGYFFMKFFLNKDKKLKFKIVKGNKHILSPIKRYETKSTWLDPCNVRAVFSCGAVPAINKEILNNNDEIFVYYGAGDTRICLAKLKLAALN